MKWMSVLIVLCMVINARSESPTNSPGKASWKPDEMHLRTGIYLEGIPAELPEDKFYPTTNNLHKLEAYQRLYGIRLETRDLPRLERAYRKWGRSDGVFNVPEWINKKDEWDGGEYREGYRIASRNEKDELLPLSRKEITENRISASPSRGNLRSVSTLGQLCKQCDGVFVGVISEIKGVTDEDRSNWKQGFVNANHPAVIVFQVKTNLFGRIIGRSVKIPIVWLEGDGNYPQLDMKVLVFYAKGYTFSILGSTGQARSPFHFDWEKPAESPSTQPHVIVKNGSNVRVLNSPEIEKSYIEAVDGYLRLLRRENRDPDKYYDFLRTLVKSPVWRIRQDAKEDLLRLWGPLGPERFDLTRILDDPELDWDLGKDYVRYIAIPDKESRMAGIKKAK